MLKNKKQSSFFPLLSLPIGTLCRCCLLWVSLFYLVLFLLTIFFLLLFGHVQYSSLFHIIGFFIWSRSIRMIDIILDSFAYCTYTRNSIFYPHAHVQISLRVQFFALLHIYLNLLVWTHLFWCLMFLLPRRGCMRSLWCGQL